MWNISLSALCRAIANFRAHRERNGQREEKANSIFSPSFDKTKSDLCIRDSFSSLRLNVSWLFLFLGTLFVPKKINSRVGKNVETVCAFKFLANQFSNILNAFNCPNTYSRHSLTTIDFSSLVSRGDLQFVLKRMVRLPVDNLDGLMNGRRSVTRALRLIERSSYPLSPLHFHSSCVDHDACRSFVRLNSRNISTTKDAQELFLLRASFNSLII